MSPLTFWLAIGAAFVFFLFAVNAVAYRMRRGTFLPRGERSPKLTRLQLVLLTLLVVAIFVGHASTFIVPASPFARWLQEPFSKLVYSAWCLIAVTFVSVSVGLWRYYKGGRESESA